MTMNRLLRRPILALIIGLLLWPLAAEPQNAPRTGLLWLRSDLPAVFPLQVKTVPGRDYHLTLIHAETGDETLAAYINGGDFFRVLVPPGRYTLRFAYGAGWQGEDALFGASTQIYEMKQPLRFATRGIGTKTGHLVDLRRLIESREAGLTRPLSICQSLRLDLQDITETPFDPGSDTMRQLMMGDLDLPRLVPRYRTYSRVCG